LQTQVFEIPRALREESYENFKKVNDKIEDKVSVLGYMPFTKLERSFKSLNVGRLKNIALGIPSQKSVF